MFSSSSSESILPSAFQGDITLTFDKNQNKLNLPQIPPFLKMIQRALKSVHSFLIHKGFEPLFNMAFILYDNTFEIFTESLGSFVVLVWDTCYH